MNLQKPQLEAIEIIPEDLPENNIHTINTIGTSPKPILVSKFNVKSKLVIGL